MHGFSSYSLMETSDPLWVESIVASRLATLASFPATKRVDLDAVQTSSTSFFDLTNGSDEK
jgi:hypothetical protein